MLNSYEAVNSCAKHYHPFIYCHRGKNTVIIYVLYYKVNT